MAFLDDYEDDGLSKTLMGQNRSYGGLGEALLRGSTEPLLTQSPIPVSQRDILLAMQHPNLQTASSASPDVPPIHVPSLAPVAAAQSRPIAASMPGQPVPSSGADKAAVDAMIESKRPDSKRTGFGLAELETRAMHLLGPLHGAKGFSVYYGDYVVPVQ